MANVPDSGPFPNFIDERMTMEQVELERCHLYVQSALSDYAALAYNAKLSVMQDQVIRQMVFQMTSWCACGRIPDSVEIEHVAWPANTWQMFKENHAPEWFTSRFPVKYERLEIKKTVNHYFVCPHIRVPDNRPHIQFMMTGTRQAERL